MTFPSLPNRVPAKLWLLLLVSTLFTHAAISASTHPRATTLASALQHSRGGGSGGSGGGFGMIAGIIAAIIAAVGGIIAAIISRSKK